MFAVFADEACTTKIYTHEYLKCRGCVQYENSDSANIKSAKSFVEVHPRKFIPSK